MKNNKLTYLSKVTFAVVVAIIATVITLTSFAAEYPYPELLNYTDLDASFQGLAKDKILPEYRDYVLNAIKYHIESPDTNYRVAKNILQKFDPDEDGNVVFFFDGCSINLDGATYTFSGYKKNGKRYNTSAVCIVVRANSKGRAEIVYATADASTMADNVRNASYNGGTDVSITRDGIYNIKTRNHHDTYAALNIMITSNASLRCPSSGKSYLATAGGINIHARTFSSDVITNSTYSSTGCFNVGKHKSSSDVADYNAFIKAVTGVSNAKSVTYPKNGMSEGHIVGITIVDRSNYKNALATIFGNDNSSSGYSGSALAEIITEKSMPWNAAVNERISTTDSEEVHSCSNCTSVNKVGYVNDTSGTPLNVRKGPGTSYNVLYQWENGTTVTVSTECGKWCYATDNNDKKGWVSSSYVAFDTSTDTENKVWDVPSTAFGIDVSHHNGEIDWEKVKNEVDFVIIRCGYGQDQPGQEDKYFAYNISECVRLGIPFGIYHYSYADTVEKAKGEAEHALRLIKGYDIPLPIFFDMEEPAQKNASATLRGQMAAAFCDTVAAAGYKVGVYSSTYWWTNYLTSSVFDNPNWTKWVAQYNTSCTYGGEYSIWQYTSTGSVNGISGNVDLNYWYGFDEFLNGENQGAEDSSGEAETPTINPSVEHSCDKCVAVKKIGYVNASSAVNIRYGPSTDYDKKSYWQRGVQLLIDAECNGWYHATDFAGNSGFASGKYVEIINATSNSAEHGFDLDGDGFINVADALVLLNSLLGENVNIKYDLSKDGKVTLIDVKRIFELVVA